MPVPGALSGVGYDDEHAPLVDRHPGLEVFWNGRLLPREHVHHHPLLRPRERGYGDRVPAACWRRVKGMIFVDSSFPVSATKLNLCSESAPVRALLDYYEDKLASEVARWVRYCHETHDQLFEFGPHDTSREQKQGIIYYQWVRLAQCKGALSVKKGTNVSARLPRQEGTGQRTFLGKVTAVCQDFKASEAAEACFLEVQEAIVEETENGDAPHHSPDSSVVRIPVSAVLRVLKEKELKEAMRRVTKRAPVKLSMVDASGNPQEWEDGMTGAELKERLTQPFRVCLVNRDGGKCQARRGTRVEVTIVGRRAAGTRDAGEDVVTAVHSCESQPPQHFVFEFTREELMRQCPDLFSFAGSYEIQLRAALDASKVLTRTLRFRVSGEGSDFSEVACGAVRAEVAVGDELDLPLFLRDSLGNPLQWDDVRDAQVTVSVADGECRLRGDARLALPLGAVGGEAGVSAIAQGFSLEGKAPGVIMLQVQVEIAGRSATCDAEINLRPGAAAGLEVIDAPERLRLGMAFCVTVRALDLGGNLADVEGLNCVVEKEMGEARLVGKQQQKVAGGGGEFRFEGLRVTHPRGEGPSADPVDVSLMFSVRSRKVMVEPARVVLTIYPAVAICLQLRGCGVRAEGPHRFSLHAEAGAVVDGLRASVTNVPAGSSVRMLCQWAQGVEITGEEDVGLPPLHVAGQCCKQDFVIKLEPPPSEEEEWQALEHVVAVTTHCGPPVKVELVNPPEAVTLLQAFSLRFTLLDRLGNRLDSKKDEGRHDILSDLTCDLTGEGIETEGLRLSRLDSDWCVEGVQATVMGSRVVILQVAGIGAVEHTIDVNPAAPVAVSLQGESRPASAPLEVRCENWGVLDAFGVGLVDATGRSVPVDDTWGQANIHIDEKPDDLMLTKAPHKRSRVGSSHTRFTGAMFCCAPPDGAERRLKLSVSLRREPMTPKAGLNTQSEPLDRAHVHVTVVPGKLPWRARAEVSGVQQQHLAINEDLGSKLEVCAGEKLGEGLLVHVITEDGSPGVLPRGRVRLKVVSPALPEPRIVSLAQGGERVVSTPVLTQMSQPPAEPLRFDGLADLECTAAGDYTVCVGLDMGNIVSRNPEAAKQFRCKRRDVDVARFRVRAARPARVCVSLHNANFDIQGHLGAFPGASGSRVLAAGLRLRVEDDFGNPCSCAGTVRFEVKRAAGAMEEDTEVPVLAGRDALVLREGAVEVPEVEVAEGKYSEGSYILLCHFAAADGEGHIEACELHFQWADDSERRALLERLADRAEALKHVAERQREEAKGLRERYDRGVASTKELEEQLEDIRQSIRSVKGPDGQSIVDTSGELDTAAELQRVRNDITQAEHSALQSRRPKVNGNPSWLPLLEHVEGYLGLVADLGYVNRPEVDRCVATAIGRMMQCVVVKDRVAAGRVRAVVKGVGEQIAILSIDNTREVRMNADGYPEHLKDPQPRPKGFVGHACNLIEMPMDRMYLRRILFSLVSGRMVFDTLDNAKDWRTAMLAAGRSVPAISCLDGQKMESTGVEYAGAKPNFSQLRFGSPGVVEHRMRGLQLLERFLKQYAAVKQKFETERAGHPSMEPCTRAEESAAETMKKRDKLLKVVAKGKVDPAVAERMLAETELSPEDSDPPAAKRRRRAK
eukprot:Hpha_TRINITY_DN15862_c1_g4::TRINITY_DN15862_c1_g4_i1::g.191768::m.191768